MKSCYYKREFLLKKFNDLVVDCSMFPCERCGACCRKIGEAPMTRHMAKDNGVCKYLNEVTNLCMIYPDRPITCRVDEFYEQCYKDKMSREEFYSIHKELCQKFQSQQF